MTQLRVMTWNVENLFDVGDDDGPETEAQLAAKIESLRAVIDEQQPHVLALQEIGSESALARLQAALSTPMPTERSPRRTTAASASRSSARGSCTSRRRSGSSPPDSSRSRWATTLPARTAHRV